MPKVENRKHILLHLIDCLEIGGAEMLLIHYIQALGAEKYHHFVYSIGNDGPMRGKIEALGVSVRVAEKRASIKHPVRFVRSIVALMKDLLRFVQKRKVTVIQSHLGESNKLSIIVGLLCNLPAFPTVHNTMAFEYPRKWWDPRKHLNRWADRLLYKRAERVVAVSEEIKHVIIRELRVPERQVVVLRNGIITSTALETEKACDIGDSIPSGPIRVLAVGSLTYQKAFEVLIDAAAQLVNDNISNFIIQIAGKGVERPMLESLIREQGLASHVELLGFRNDIYDLMSRADIFVIPSRYEGLSIAMIEAMAFGLPIIASDAPGLNAYVQHSINGLLFPTGNSNALKERLEFLIESNDKRVDFGVSAKNYFRRFFNMKDNIMALDRLYQNL